MAVDIHYFAEERDHLDPRVQEGAQAAGPSLETQDEPEDYSPSGSSWAPSDDGAMSAESDRVCSSRH